MGLDKDKDMPESSGGEIVSETSSQIDPHKIAHRKCKIFLAGLTMALYANAEQNFFTFCCAMFQYLDIGFSAKDAALLMSLLYATFTGGRLVTAFISHKLKPDTIIMYHFVIIIGAIGIMYVGRQTQLWIYIGTMILGAGFSAMWPAQAC